MACMGNKTILLGPILSAWCGGSVFIFTSYAYANQRLCLSHVLCVLNSHCPCDKTGSIVFPLIKKNPEIVEMQSLIC